MLSSTPILAQFDPAAPTFLSTDASGVGLGAVLSQLHGKVERPVAFCSKTLSERERRFSVGEREALACVWACEKWHTFLWGRRFVLRTDHSALTTLLDTTGGKGHRPMRISRWYARLLPYSYDIQYRAGSENQVADALSRLPSQSGPPSEDPDSDIDIVAFVAPDSAISEAEFLAESKADPTISAVLQYIRNGWPASPKQLDAALLPFHKVRDELSGFKDCVIRGDSVVVPPTSLRPRLISMAHEAHPGITRTKQRLRSSYWWPRMDPAIEFTVRSCAACQDSDKSAKVRTPPLLPVDIPDEPWTKLAIDITGPIRDAPLNSQYLVVLSDYLSKFPEVLATGNITSTAIIQFLKDVFARLGNPSELVSDNGTQFTSHEFTEFLKSRGIKHIRTAVYNPSSNGFVERLNRSLCGSLQATLKDGTPFRDAVRDVLSTYRSTPHGATGKTPAELLLSRTIRTKFHPPAGLQKALKPQMPDNSGSKLQNRLRNYQEKYRLYSNKRNSAKPSNFQIGSYVRFKLPSHLKGRSGFSRPLRILQKVGEDTYLLESGQRWNARLLTAAHPPSEPPDDDANLADAFPAPPPAAHGRPGRRRNRGPPQPRALPPRARRQREMFQAGFG